MDAPSWCSMAIGRCFEHAHPDLHGMLACTVRWRLVAWLFASRDPTGARSVRRFGGAKPLWCRALRDHRLPAAPPPLEQADLSWRPPHDEPHRRDLQRTCPENTRMRGLKRLLVGVRRTGHLENALGREFPQESRSFERFRSGWRPLDHKWMLDSIPRHVPIERLSIATAKQHGKRHLRPVLMPDCHDDRVVARRMTSRRGASPGERTTKP